MLWTTQNENSGSFTSGWLFFINVHLPMICTQSLALGYVGSQFQSLSSSFRHFCICTYVHIFAHVCIEYPLCIAMFSLYRKMGKSTSMARFCGYCLHSLLVSKCVRAGAFNPIPYSFNSLQWRHTQTESAHLIIARVAPLRWRVYPRDQSRISAGVHKSLIYAPTSLQWVKWIGYSRIYIKGVLRDFW